MREARRYLEERREFHNLAISTSLVGQMVVAHYFLKKPPEKTAKRVPGLRPPAPCYCSPSSGWCFLACMSEFVAQVRSLRGSGHGSGWGCEALGEDKENGKKDGHESILNTYPSRICILLAHYVYFRMCILLAHYVYFRMYSL